MRSPLTSDVVFVASGDRLSDRRASLCKTRARFERTRLCVEGKDTEPRPCPPAPVRHLAFTMAPRRASRRNALRSWPFTAFGSAGSPCEVRERANHSSCVHDAAESRPAAARRVDRGAQALGCACTTSHAAASPTPNAEIVERLTSITFASTPSLDAVDGSRSRAIVKRRRRHIRAISSRCARPSGAVAHECQTSAQSLGSVSRASHEVQSCRLRAPGLIVQA